MLTYLFLFIGAVACAFVAAWMLLGAASYGQTRENVMQFPHDKRREKLG